MRLLVIRHAHAIDLTPDAARTLSDKGREQARRLGLVLKGDPGFKAKEFWHSSLVRARETAEIVAHVVGGVTLREVEGLRPEDDPRPVAGKAAAFGRDLAIFGHEPHLGNFGGYLMFGDMGPPMVFRKACGYLFAPTPGSQRWQMVTSVDYDQE